MESQNHKRILAYTKFWQQTPYIDIIGVLLLAGDLKGL